MLLPGVEPIVIPWFVPDKPKPTLYQLVFGTTAQLIKSVTDVPLVHPVVQNGGKQVESEGATNSDIAAIKPGEVTRSCAFAKSSCKLYKNVFSNSFKGSVPSTYSDAPEN